MKDDEVLYQKINGVSVAELLARRPRSKDVSAEVLSPRFHDEVRDTLIGYEFPQFKLPMIVVYQNPSDYPGMFVARVFDMQTPKNQVVVKHSIEEIRKAIPQGRFYRIDRNEADDPTIVETWL